MRKARVPLHGKPHGYITVEADATRGATVGVDLLWPDGGVVSAQALSAAMQSGATPPGQGDGGTYLHLIEQVARGAVQASAPVLDPLPPDAPDDAAAAAAGVPVGGLYRDGSVLMIRTG